MKRYKTSTTSTKMEAKMKNVTGNRLVTVNEMAKMLGVPKSWLYQRTRLGAQGIPHIRFGKYVRFDPDVVIAHYAAKEKTGEYLLR
jgi:excisionase family DNA binding protein